MSGSWKSPKLRGSAVHTRLPIREALDDGATWICAPPDSREGGARGVYSEDASGWQRATFSPLGSPLTSFRLSARDSDPHSTGYRYQFSPVPAQRNEVRQQPLRSGRGWSQFSRQSGRNEMASTGWRHPENPDLTPQHFWNVLNECRETHNQIRDSIVGQVDSLVDDSILVPGLPQIVPKLDLTRVPRKYEKQPMPGPRTEQHGIPPLIHYKENVQQQLRDACKEKTGKTGQSRRTMRKRESYAHEERRMTSEPRIARHPDIFSKQLNFPDHNAAAVSNPMGGDRDQQNAKFDDVQSLRGLFSSTKGGQQRSLLATDTELMNLQHRKLGIKPQGTKWDLRGHLKAGDKTLEVAQVAAAIMANQNLEDLDVRGNELDGACGGILAAALVGHSRIKTVSGIPLREIMENGMPEIILKPASGVDSIGPAEIVLLATFLSEANALVKLNLSGIMVGPEGFLTLGFAIRRHSELTHLDLSRTCMQAANFNNILPGLLHCSQLTELHLATNLLDSQVMFDLQHLMAKSLFELRVLNVRNNLLGASGASTFGGALNNQISEVDISNNQIGADGCETLLRSLQGHRWPNLESLNLSFNGMNVTAASVLIEVLHGMRNLRFLKIHGNIPVADVRSKRVLFLSGMGYRELEGLVIADLLRQNMHVRKIDLRGNELGPNSINALSTVLMKLDRLKDLNNEAFNLEMRVPEIERILFASMNVASRAKTPAEHRLDGVPRFSFMTLSIPHIRKEEAANAGDISQEDDGEDDYQNTFRDWKQNALRPHTAAVSDAGDGSDVDSPGRLPPRVGFYGCRRNPRLRRKAYESEDRKKAPVLTHEFAVDHNSTSTKPALFVTDCSTTRSEGDSECSDGGNSSVPNTFKRRSVGTDPNTCLDSKKLLTIDVSESTLKIRDSIVPAGSSRRNTAKSQRSSILSSTLQMHVMQSKSKLSYAGAHQSSRESTTFNSNASRKKAVTVLDVKGSELRLAGIMGAFKFKTRIAGAFNQRKWSIGTRSADVLANNRVCHHAGSKMGPSGAKILAAELRSAPARFVSVDLSLNNLTGLDEFAVGEADMGGFKSLCSALRRNNGITSLNFAWNRLGSEAISFLKPVLEANPYLIELDLYKNDIQEVGMKTLSSCFECMPCLKELNLRYNSIGPAGAEILAGSLHHLQDLVTFDAAGNNFSHTGLKSLMPVLVHLPELSRLHLQENDGGVLGSRALVEYVMNCSTSLGELNGLSVSNLLTLSEEKLPTKFESYESLYLAGELFQVMNRDPTIKFWNLHAALSPYLSNIDLSRCHLKDFPESIMALTSLAVLDISCNGLTSIPVRQLCEVTSLIELICNGNYNLRNPPADVADQGGKAVMLYLNESIRSGMKDDEVALIAVGAEAVGKSSCLSCLVTGVGRTIVKTSVVPHENEFEDGTPLFRGEPLFNPAWLDRAGIEKELYPLYVSDTDDSSLTGPNETAVANVVYWRAEDELQYIIYDLPGHPFYSTSNRIFLKRRAVYLLVWKVYDYHSDENMAKGMFSVCAEIASMLENVQSVHPGAYFLAVATHTDVTDTLKVFHQMHIVCKAIQKKVAEIKSRGDNCPKIFNDGCSCLLSCKSGDGIAAFRRDLVKFTNSIDVFKAHVPKSYLQLRSGLRLLRSRHALLNWGAYKKLAQLCGLEGDALQVATRIMHDRGYLTFFDVDKTVSRHKSLNLRLKTVIKVHQRIGWSLKLAQDRPDEPENLEDVSKTSEQTLRGTEDDVMVCTSPHWLIRVLRGLFNPDIELMIEWFSGATAKESCNLSLLRSTINFLKNGILERKLVYYLWPCLEKDQFKSFWRAYSDHGVGPLKSHEGNLVREDKDYDSLISILEHFHIITKMTKTSFWVTSRQTDITAASHITDARVFRPFRTGVCNEIRYDFLPPEFFQVLMALCAKIKNVWTNERIDKLDYCSKAATLYWKGDKVQFFVRDAPRTPYYSIHFNATTLELAQSVHDKVHVAEHMYPGLVRVELDRKDNFVEAEEVPNILFCYSLLAVPHAEIVAEEVRKYSKSFKVLMQHVAQFSKILECLSLGGRDLIRSKHIKSIGKLRLLASNQGNLSKEKLAKSGLCDADSKVIYHALNAQSFDGQVVILCLDELYTDECECDWFSVCKHVQGGAFLILVLLPGCKISDNLPLKPISVIDLRFVDWIRHGRKLELPHSERVPLRDRLEPLIHKLLLSWRGLPLTVSDFDDPSVPCKKCVLDGEPERKRFDFHEHVMLNHNYLMNRLQTGESLTDAPTVYCINEHSTTLEDILCSTTTMTATACPACIEQGKPLPHCFSRQSCLDVLHGKKILIGAEGRCKDNGFELTCPQCRSEQLDLVDILQAEVFVSYCKKKVKCTSCGKGNIGCPPEGTHGSQRRHLQRSLLFDRQQNRDTKTAHVSSYGMESAGGIKGAAGFHRLSSTEGVSGQDSFFCQDCNLNFGQAELDQQVSTVQNVVGYLEEHLDVLVVKPSILYSLSDMVTVGGPVAIKAAKTASVFIAVMDNTYYKSHACMAEFSAAVKMSRPIIPVLLPGYTSNNGSNWWPIDAKYKRSDGVHMVVPFSVLKNFAPISVDYGDEGYGRDSKLAWSLLISLCLRLYGGVRDQKRTVQLYAEWRKVCSVQRSSHLGSWANIEPEEGDRKITRIWRRHGQYLDKINIMKRELANAGIKASEQEITQALAEVSVTFKTMGANEFRIFVWNLVSNIRIKIDQMEVHKQ